MKETDVRRAALRSRVIAMHRLANPAANHAAQALVIYDLQRRPETAPATAPQQ